MTRKLFVALAAAIVAAAFPAMAKSHSLLSPDGSICIDVENLAYTVSVDGKQVLAPSRIAMTLGDGTVWDGKSKLKKARTVSVDAAIDAINYKRSQVTDRYNQLTLDYKAFSVIFRAYDDGVAYRIVSGSKAPVTVKDETVDFKFPQDDNAFVAYGNKPDYAPGMSLDIQCANSFENIYTHGTLGTMDSGRLAFLPILVEDPSGIKLCITEADLFDFPGLQILCGEASLNGYHARYPDAVTQGGHHMLQGRIQTRKDHIAESPAMAEYPWRIIQIARNDIELAGSDMVYRLASAPEECDWSWVKPGKVAWDWWNAWNIYGVPFKSGINNETYKYYIDFASSKGIEYVILDEGWAVKNQADLFQIIPEINIRELVEYGAERGVGIILWAGYWAVNRDMEHVFSHYSQMGVKGFKIDFMDRDDQQMVDFFNACARMGAKYRMLIDFHGAYKPTGLQRTYPNVLNFEGVHGLEQMKWENSDVQIAYDVTIPYIRMMAGPMDYTQGAMRNATKKNYRAVNSEPMSLGTRCRQLAEYIIFDAPFTMLCDSPSAYMAEPECTGFIASIPTVWDQTVCLAGKVAESIMMARRSGSDWYVGAMTDWTERDICVDFSFLPEGVTFEADIYADGPNADKAARDYARSLVKVTRDTRMNIHLAPGGGWAACLKAGN